MTTTWTIAIDWNRDGDYSDSYEDVTSRVISVKWFLGQRKPYQDTADNTLLELLLYQFYWTIACNVTGSTGFGG